MKFRCVESCHAFADIYIASPYEETLMFLRRYCESGFCVNVSRCDYVYKFGMESGVKIGLINYPRFPTEQENLTKLALEIGLGLAEHTGQGSFTITTPNCSKFYSRRGDVD